MSAGGCLSAIVESSVKVVAVLIGVPLVIVALLYFVVFLFLAVIKYFEFWSTLGPLGVIIGLLAPIVLVFAALIYFSRRKDTEE